VQRNHPVNAGGDAEQVVLCTDCRQLLSALQDGELAPYFAMRITLLL